MTAQPIAAPRLTHGPELDLGLPPLTAWPRRVLKRPGLMHHNRLVVLVLAVNLGVLWFGLAVTGRLTEPAAWSNAALANVVLAVLVRQQYVINLLFWLATRAPVHWPLRIRWTLAKVYHFGGLHVGGALAGVLWFLGFTALSTIEAVHRPAVPSYGMLATSYALVLVLFTIVATALPRIRARRHDRFERTHRFGGWTALALLWTQTALVHGTGLLGTPSFWALVLMTASICLPWLRLRRVQVIIDRPSPHVALARFDHGVTPFPGSSTTISRAPLREWHAFANIPAPGRPGFRLAISRAGDWTGTFIDDQPRHVWVKGITTAGVANIETLFRSVVYVATGSGIGPVLPHLLAKKVPSRLVWATRSARETYGDALLDEITAAEPGAIIWDTVEQGKPDMVRLAYAAYRDFDAEAVICISNKKLTWQVVHGLERRGIPAYGAIWDS